MSIVRVAVSASVTAALIGTAACSNHASLMPSPATGAQSYDSVPYEVDATRVRIRQFSDLPQYSGGYIPSAVANFRQSLWVTDTIDQDSGENVVVQIAPSGKALHDFYYGGIESEGADFADIVPGPDGNLWITDAYNWQILKMTTQGQFTGFLLPAAPVGITVGPDKALWFTEGTTIGRITTSGRMTSYDAGGYSKNITTGPDGALWFTEYAADAIGRITTSGKVTQYTKGITAGSAPLWIAAGPDGALWFTENRGGRIGRITTSGKVTEYSRGITDGENPYGIAKGSDGAMWFTEGMTDTESHSTNAKIGRITMSGAIVEFSNGLSSDSNPGMIAKGPGTNMWFVESNADRTGRLGY